MLHFVTSYMKQNKSRKQTLESAQYGLEIIFKSFINQIMINFGNENTRFDDLRLYTFLHSPYQDTCSHDAEFHVST